MNFFDFNLFFFFRDYTANPYCSFTFGFWFRATSVSDSNYQFIYNQGKGPSAGFDITLKSTFTFFILLPNYYVSCLIDEYIDEIKTQWNFFAVTFDQTTNKWFCAFNDSIYKAFTDEGPLPSIIEVTNPLTFGGSGVFFVDDVLFIPKHSTAAMMSAIYNKSKFQNEFNHFCKSIVIKKFHRNKL